MVIQRRRTIAIIAVVATVLIVAASWWRITLDRAGHERALTRIGQTTAVLTETRSSLAAAFIDADTTEAVTRSTLQERDSLSALATSLQVEIDRTQSQRNTTAVAAFTTGARASVLARCLGGVQQALNQLSVGDVGALGSLKKVEQPCREAGA